jgi:RNA polymerase primary sigma factor
LKQVIEELKNRARQKGYITFDEIITSSEKAHLGLKSMDSLVGLLMDEGFIVLEDEPAQETGIIIDDSAYDKSQIDYEEIFSEAIRIAPQLSNYIDEVRNIPAPRLGEEAELIILAKEGNDYAFSRLVLMFLKVVVREALNYHKRYGFILEEAIQDGNVGLIIAVEKFNIAPGNRFSSYAPWWIQQSIMRNSAGVGDKFYFPMHMKEKFHKLIKHIGPNKIEMFQGNLRQAINISAAAESTGFESRKIIKYLRYLEDPLSFSEFDDDRHILASNHYLEDEIIDRVFYQFLVERIQGILFEFKERDRKIIEMRYGFGETMPMTLEEVGENIGVTRERIRQIEERLIPKIKRKIQKYTVGAF